MGRQPIPIENKLKTSFTLARETVEAIDELKDGLRHAVPLASRIASRGLVLELAVNYALEQIVLGNVSYDEFFVTPYHKVAKKRHAQRSTERPIVPVGGQ